MKKVLLGTDGSEHSLRAATVLGKMVADMPEVSVTVVYVVHVPPELHMSDVYGNKVVPEIPLDVMIRRSAEPIINRTVEALGLPKQRIHSEVQVGDPAEELVELARLEEYDLIVVGSRGVGPLQELILGSVSNKVLHGANCPVLVVR